MKELSSIAVLLSLLVVSPAAAQQPPTIDGWDGIQFGMSSAEVLAAQPGMTWQGTDKTGLCDGDPKAWPFSSCTLTRGQPVVIVGVPFTVTVSLDASGRVNQIWLEFSERRSPRDRDQCLTVTERARSAIASRFGEMIDERHSIPGHLSYRRSVDLDPVLAAKLAAPPSTMAVIRVDGSHQDFEDLATIIRRIPNHTPEELDNARNTITPLCVTRVTYDVTLPEILQADTGKF